MENARQCQSTRRSAKVRTVRRITPRITACLVGLLSAAPPASASERDLIGYTTLAGRPGALLANGAGIPVAQVEVFAPNTSDYAPDQTSPMMTGKSFTFRSGASGVSSHAEQVGSLFYGNSLSPAPAVTDVQLFSADSFITGLLRAGRANRAPGGVGARVVNNSWIASFPDDAQNVDVLRRLDDLINRDDVLVVNAVSNIASDPFPTLMASSFNGVTVGSLSGSHGPVTYDAPGARIKPDLVVDTGITSNSTGLASGAAALLQSEANARGVSLGELATKAILMTGAERDLRWHRGRASGKDNATAPLDFQQGAGQLRVDRSFDILLAGRQPAGASIAPAAGWDFARTSRGAAHEATYFLHLGTTATNWSAFLTWNRLIEGVTADGGYSTAETTPDFALSLYLSKRGGRRLVATSDSPNDNVESLTLTDLAAGDYQLVLSSDVRSYYAMAWTADGVSALPAGLTAPALESAPSAATTGAFMTAMPEPGMGLVAPVMIVLALRRSVGKSDRI